MNRDALLRSLLLHEGLRLHPYTDPAGRLTIGIGRNLTDAGISEDEAFGLAQHDIDRCVDALEANLPWWSGLDDLRQNVLLELCFMLGWVGLSKFRRMLDAAEHHEFDRAGDEIMQSQLPQQVGQRAVELAHQMRTGGTA